MRIARFYCSELDPNSEVLTLPAQVHRHAIQVLRLKSGEELCLFDGSGIEYTAQLEQVNKRESTARIIQTRQVDKESPLKTTLIQGISRGEKMDYTLQKAVELGVNQIIPVMTERCNVSLSGERAEKKRLHWQGVIISACEQSGRSIIPQLGPILSFEELLQTPLPGTTLILDPLAEIKIASLEKNETVNLLIGPEGGLTEREIEVAKQSNFHAVQFGPRILRTETAAVAVLAVIQTLWGDMGG
jgi:16S rRNA (uracil1498-N3)-methyltransferase